MTKKPEILVLECDMYHVTASLRGNCNSNNFICPLRSKYDGPTEVNCSDMNPCPIYRSLREKSFLSTYNEFSTNSKKTKLKGVIH